MKKSLAVILIAALAISLTACGEAEVQAPVETTVSEETVTESVEVTTEVEEAEEPEVIEEPEEEPAPVATIKLAFTKAVNDYVGYAYGGIVPVKRDGKHGAEDYTGAEVVPCEYDSFQAPNEAGYFVLGKSGTYYLFDNKGNVVYSGTDSVIASGDMYTVTRYSEDGMVTLEYYDFSGKLLTSVDTNADYMEYMYFSGMNDGKALVMRNVGDDSFFPLKDETQNHYFPYEIGTVSSDGKIDWIDGDGLDETDPTKVITYEEKMQQRADSAKNSGFNGAAGSAGDRTACPLSPLCEGYFMTYSYFDGQVALHDASGNILSAIDLYGLNFSSPDSASWDIRDARIGDREYKIYSMNSGSEGEIVSFYEDGARIYNYGTKAVFKSDDVYALMDMKITGDKPTIKTYDYIVPCKEKYWLASKEDKWGYADHEGEIVKMYDDAACFRNGHAVIIDSGIAKFIDEDFNVLEELGPATRVYQSGDLYVVDKEDAKECYLLEWE